VRLHLLDPGAETRWTRVQGRNDQQGETVRLAVTRPMFDFIESVRQRPTEQERVDLHGLHVA
jgi:hypothetical protein